MAATIENSVSKAEYLKRYLDPEEKKVKRRKKRKMPELRGMRIVDDDAEEWKRGAKQEEAIEEDDDQPVVAEFVDERPEEVKRIEEFRSSHKWRLIQDTGDESPGTDPSLPHGSRVGSEVPAHSLERKHESLDYSSPQSFLRHDSDLFPPKKSQSKGLDSDLSPKRIGQRRVSDSELSPPRKNLQAESDSDLSPPRRGQRKSSDPGLCPPHCRHGGERHTTIVSSVRQRNSQTLSGDRAGLVPAEMLREEMEEQRKTQKFNKDLEDDSKNAQTVFRNKSGKRRDLRTEREKQLQIEAEQMKTDQLYALWGKGLAQKKQQRQNVEDAAREMEKPLARYISDSDLDKILREEKREGDPMANFLGTKKEKMGKEKKERPKYKGPNPLPNRFKIWPGYRWDGVDRSNGFEMQRFSRFAEKKALQEAAYKWSVEDM